MSLFRIRELSLQEETEEFRYLILGSESFLWAIKISERAGLIGISSKSSIGFSSAYVCSSDFSSISTCSLSSIVSFRGLPWVSERQQAKKQATKPIRAGGNQEFMWKPLAMLLTKGESMLPIIPATLVHPKPRLLISVGQSQATQTKKIDQNPHRTNRLNIRAIVSSHMKICWLSGFSIMTMIPRTRQKPVESPIPRKLAFLRWHLWITSSADKYPSISLMPKTIWLMVLVNPTLPSFRVELQQMAWIPKKIIAAEIDVQRMLLNLNRSKKPSPFCSGSSPCSYSLHSRWAMSSAFNSERPFLAAILFSTTRASAGCFLRRNIGVSSRKISMAIEARTKRISIMKRMAFQESPVRNIRAMLVSPMAHAACTPTPYVCLLFPRHTSFMNEKHNVIAGLVPNPMRKRPIPNIFVESERAVSSTERVPMPQAIRMASLLPKLSAMKGITKKPIREPRNIMSCKIDTAVQWSGQIRYYSNEKMMDQACQSIAEARQLLGSPQT